MVREERLSAEPIKRITVDGGEGWLYLWNNGDTQMLWAKPPQRATRAAACGSERPQKSA